MKQPALLNIVVIATFIVAGLSFFNPVLAQNLDKIVVATETWEDNTNADGTGSFFDIIREVYAMDGISMEYVVVPYERSVEMTKNQEVDAWVAAYDEEEDFALFPEWHFDADVVTAVYKKDRFPGFAGVESLSGKVVSWIRGYAYDDYIEEDMNIYRLDKRTSAIEMLVRDRIDIYLDAQAEVEGMISDKEFNQKAKFVIDQFEFKEVMNLNLYLAFSNSPRSQALIEVWDRNFPILLESGRIQEIYNEYEVTGFPF